MTAAKRQLGMLAKYWARGAVKTRLAADSGTDWAARLYRCFVTTLAARLASFPARRTVAFWPPSRAAEFRRAIGPAWELEPQIEGDLGTRMQHYFHHALGTGQQQTRSAVLIGSDSPTIPTAVIEQAFTLLEQYPAVLGPTRDGGYYLVGLARLVPDMFDGIAWSTPQVWEQTTSRLNAQGLPYSTLPMWYDVDTVDDLQRLRDQLTSDCLHETCYDKLRAMVAAVG
jgi:rSAM/selenodomain-associated transferase 1